MRLLPRNVLVALDMRGWLVRLTCPITYLNGTHDPIALEVATNENASATADAEFSGKAFINYLSGNVNSSTALPNAMTPWLHLTSYGRVYCWAKRWGIFLKQTTQF